jgi:dihydrofolate synthase/folylpolyglutamate synthase
MTCVIEACRVLREYFGISDANIVNGIAKTTLPARVEIINDKPLVILDGGHNEDGAKAFFDAVSRVLKTKSKVIVIAGMMGDKAVEKSLEPLMKATDVFYAVTPENPRAMSAQELSVIAQKHVRQVYAIDKINDAVKSAYEKVTENDALLIVGSLYLAGEVRQTLLEMFKN